MLSFLYRSSIAFATVAVVFYLYAVTVVPLIDTQVAQKKIEIENPAQNNNQRYEKLITNLFPEDDWIRDRCKILDAKQSILFFKEARQLEDGNWEVKPFTMFLNPDEALVEGEQDNAGTREKPIILRTLEGAYIKFEEGTSPNSPSGKFSGARMPGHVTVIREESKSGASDNFLFETRNIQVNTKQILAVNPVRFEYGKHYGSGHNLTINLASREKSKKKKRQPLVRNLKTVELAHLEEILLMPESDKKELASKGTDRSNNQTMESGTGSLSEKLDESPVRVTCTGPFRLDFGKSKMILFDEVHLEQLHAEKPHDHLYCDRLEVLFKLAKKKGALTNGQPPQSSEPSQEEQINLRSVNAYGSPARFVIESRNAYAQAFEVNYHIRRRIIHCKQNVLIRDNEHQFIAPEMEYQFTLNNQLGTGWATGPGQVIGYPDDAEKVFKATWDSEFNVQPHEGKKAISLHGNAQIVFQNEKNFRCEELHFWIWEKRQKGSKAKWDYFPAQMLARQRVAMNAPEFAGSVDELRIFWPKPIGVIPKSNRNRDRQTKSSKSGVGQLVSQTKSIPAENPGPDRNKPAPKPPIENRIIGNGRLATAYLTRRNDLQSFRLEGDPIPNGQPTGTETPVHVQSLDLTTLSPQGSPVVQLDVKGADIQVDATSRKDAYKVSVKGWPAKIETEGVKFEAPVLTVDQATNKAWSHVPGLVEVSPAIRSGQRPFGPQPMTTIRWNKKFEFDGRVLRLTDNVRFEGLDYLETGEQVTYDGRTRELAALTNRRVNFKKTLDTSQNSNAEPQNKKPIKIQELALLQDAFIKAVTRESVDEVKSIEEIQCTEIVLRTDTGDAQALGPGSIRSIRRGEKRGEKQPDSQQPSFVSGIAGGDGELAYLEVAFNGRIVGNFKDRRGKILEKIRTVYGPAKDWNVRYDPDATSIFGEEIYLNCDEMEFSQWTPAKSSKPLIEMAAKGNTEIEGKKFRALASQLTYTAENEVVQLEGLDRTTARIWFRKEQTQPWQYGEAKKFRYQKSTGEIIDAQGVVDMRSLQFEAPQKRRK